MFKYKYFQTMITCLKETGIFIRIHKIVQKFLEKQWKDSAVWSTTRCQNGGQNIN